MAGARIKFPNTKSCTRGNRAVLCTADRLIELYNQNSGDSAKRICKKVRAWFAREAKDKGWAGVQFIQEIQSKHGAGCILWLPQGEDKSLIKITSTMYILKPQIE